MVNALELFDRMPYRVVISWNAIFDGFSLNGIYIHSIWLLVGYAEKEVKLDTIIPPFLPQM